MKKLLGILVLGLLFCNVGLAEDKDFESLLVSKSLVIKEDYHQKNTHEINFYKNGTGRWNVQDNYMYTVFEWKKGIYKDKPMIRILNSQYGSGMLQIDFETKKGEFNFSSMYSGGSTRKFTLIDRRTKIAELPENNKPKKK